MAGGAVQAACRAVREQLDERAAAIGGTPSIAELLAAGPIDATRTYRHAPTAELHPDSGQGDSHAGFGFVAHRAVVDVDVELGLARVVELACAQDVGRAINPLALEGQLEGGSIQGLGLALTEELEIEDGLVRTMGFGEYRIPTIVDAPPVRAIVLELADPQTPYGLRGAGEMPSISSTPAVLAALRAATGRPVTHAPARPEDLIADDPEDRA
jgi:CO/xanthine dehydrogenase Mo-binding subunit